MEEKKLPLKIKIFISLLSLLFSLVLMETGLRIAGYFYVSSRISKDIKQKKAPGHKVILCVGDSYTFGGLVAADETYPAYLSASLNPGDKANKYSVINQGVCEYNSWQLLNSLPEWIEIYDPDIVILLVVAANRYNYQGLERYQGLKQEKLSFLKNMFSDLRVVKMIRILYLNLKGKNIQYRTIVDSSLPRGTGGVGLPDLTIDYWGGEQAIKTLKDREFAIILSCCYRGDTARAIKLCEEYLKQNPESPKHMYVLGYCYYVQENYLEAEKWYLKAAEIDNEQGTGRRRLAEFYLATARRCVRKADYGKAVGYFARAIEYDPDGGPHGRIYYYMRKAYELQSEFDSTYIVRLLTGMLDRNPRLKQNERFMHNLYLFENSCRWEVIIKNWLKNDLDKIAELVTGKGIKLVVQNYPCEFSMANEVLRAAAARHSLPLVDNRSVFRDLVKEKGKEFYFKDDEHCTAKGHQVMAKNIKEVLVTGGLISE